MSVNEYWHHHILYGLLEVLGWLPSTMMNEVIDKIDDVQFVLKLHSWSQSSGKRQYLSV